MTMSTEVGVIPMPPEPVFTDVWCPFTGPETARDGFCHACGATDHEEA